LPSGLHWVQNIVMTEPTLQAVLDAITGLDTRLTGQVNALDGNLTGQITALRGDVMRRIDRLQDSFSALREDIGAVAPRLTRPPSRRRCA